MPRFKFQCLPSLDGLANSSSSFQYVSAASIYLTAKPSAHPVSTRSILNVYAYLLSQHSILYTSFVDAPKPDAESYYISEGTYQVQTKRLLKTESQILRVLGFQTHVALPYNLAINYIQALGMHSHPKSSEFSRRVFEHLTGSLMNPQLLYLTHQPPTLATAAIYLAAKEVGIKMPNVEWWEVFDTDREELGFLVVGMQSLQGFADGEWQKWGNGDGKFRAPLTITEVEEELERRKLMESGQ
jgi:hypothetical protein